MLVTSQTFELKHGATKIIINYTDWLSGGVAMATVKAAYIITAVKECLFVANINFTHISTDETYSYKIMF